MTLWPAVLARYPGWLSLGAGALAACGQAPLSLWPLPLIGLFALFALHATAPSARQGARAAWLFGGGYFALSLSWIVEPFLVDIARHGWMAPFALALMAFGLALFWAAAGWISARLFKGPARALALAIGLAMAELARAYVFTGFPWAAPGHIWIGTPVAQLAAFGGAHLLTALALVPVVLLIAWGWRGGIAAVMILAMAWAIGAERLSRPMPVPGDAITVRLLQPNAAQHLKWRADKIPLYFHRQLDYTTIAPTPDLIVWPETAVPYLLENAGGALQVIAEAANGAPVAFGIQRRDEHGFHNSLAVIDPAGQPTHVYDKHHLVPFGEYMPLQPLAARLGIAGLAANDVFGYAAGPGVRTLDLGRAGHVLPLICYEAVFAQDLRAQTRPDWLLHITNDAWFGAFLGPYQHLAQARLRAIEQGLPLLRSANTGVSAVIDARGRIQDQLPLNTAGYLDAPLPAPLPATFYARWGDWPMGFAYLVAGMALLTWRVRRDP